MCHALLTRSMVPTFTLLYTADKRCLKRVLPYVGAWDVVCEGGGNPSRGGWKQRGVPGPWAARSQDWRVTFPYHCHPEVTPLFVTFQIKQRDFGFRVEPVVTQPAAG